MVKQNLQKKASIVKEELKKHFKGSSELIDVFLAGFFSKSKILLYGGAGKGKSLLSEATAKLVGASYSRVQGSTGLTESKYLARYDIAKLMKGEEKVKWRDFTHAQVKLFDEISRAPPVLLNSIFSMLQEKIVIFGDERFEVPDYCFLATMNPLDSASADLPFPLIDRFDICLLLPSVSFSEKIDLYEISKNNGGLNLKSVFDKKDLELIWKDVESVKVEADVKILMASFTKDLQLCVYGEKEFLTNFPACCQDCRFREWICSKIDNRAPISERLALSVLKVSQAYAYLNGRDRVLKEDIVLVLPYALNHRLKVTSSYAMKMISRKSVVSSIVEKLVEKDIEREEAYRLIRAIIKSNDIEKLLLLKDYVKNDLLLKEIYEELKIKMESKGDYFMRTLKSKTPEELEVILTQLVSKKNSKHLVEATQKLLEPHLRITGYQLLREEMLSFIAGFSKIAAPFAKEFRKAFVGAQHSNEVEVSADGIYISWERVNLKNFRLKIKPNTMKRKNEIVTLLRSVSKMKPVKKV